MKKFTFYIIGFFAFLWFLLRSGGNPKRLSYPCQQAAFPLAAAWAVAVGTSIGAKTWQEEIESIMSRYGIALVKLLIMLIAIDSVVIPVINELRMNKPVRVGAYPVWASANPVSEIFIFEDIPASHGSLAAGNASVHDSVLNDKGIDSLFAIMATNGLPFHKTQSTPTGLIDTADIVILKVNFQWRFRLSTNTDRIKGVIWQILNHPDGFAGEILVADNGSAQIQPSHVFNGFDYSNNSDDTDQDIYDVVNTFKAKGYPVDWYIIDDLNNDIVAEYSADDFDDGYLYNSTTKVNYPKFRTPGGSYISFKYGVYDSVNSVYVDNLKLINMPVLKAHGITGATIAVKNWIGVMNQIHNDTWYGGYNEFHDNYVYNSFAVPARTLEETWPDLNIVDATYTSTVNNWEPGRESVKTNTILASTDPYAVSYYSAKYILTPVASYPNDTNPDYEGTGYSFYSIALGHWAGWADTNGSYDITIDSSEMVIFSSMGEGIPVSGVSRWVAREGKRVYIDGINKIIKRW